VHQEIGRANNTIDKNTLSNNVVASICVNKKIAVASVASSIISHQKGDFMYFTDDSLFPENMQPTIITAAPYGPEWLPGDVDDLPLTFDQQVQAAVDC
jgi:hypothetical protein